MPNPTFNFRSALLHRTLTRRVNYPLAATSIGQWRCIELNRVRTFDATPHALDGALLQPVLRFFQVRQRAGVRLAGIRPSLKPAPDFIRWALRGAQSFLNSPLPVVRRWQ